MNKEFCERCGCQLDEDSWKNGLCEDCYSEYLDENEIYE